MKKYKSLIPVLAVMIVAPLMFMGVTLNLTGAGRAVSTVSGTFTDSQVDTIKWTREPLVNALSFGAKFNDTVEVTTARVLRVINGVPVNQGACLAGDTLLNLTALDQTTTAAITAGITTSDAITLSGISYSVAAARLEVPLADAYWVIVQYNSSGNSAVGGTVTYQLTKQYTTR